MTNTVQQILQSAKQQLDTSSDSSSADAEILLCHVLECDRAYLYTWPEKKPGQNQLDRFQALLQRRLQGEPVAYLIGQRSFWDFKLSVSSATLIPRPETELLVEQALIHIPENSHGRVLDLGTGTGAIALAIAHERPACQVIAVERSESARLMAEKNISQYSQGNVQLQAGDWFSALEQQTFDVIVSNPPYIAEQDPHLQQGDVCHEPRTALSAGIDGLDDIRHIIAQAGSYLGPNGWLLIEHGYDQAEAVKHLFLKHGFTEVSHANDLSGHPRISSGCYKKQHQG